MQYKFWPLAIYFKCELQTVKIGSNYFQKFDWSVADFIPFHGKYVDLMNWGPMSDCVISDILCYSGPCYNGGLLYNNTFQVIYI